MGPQDSLNRIESLGHGPTSVSWQDSAHVWFIFLVGNLSESTVMIDDLRWCGKAPFGCLKNRTLCFWRGFGLGLERNHTWIMASLLSRDYAKCMFNNYAHLSHLCVCDQSVFVFKHARSSCRRATIQFKIIFHTESGFKTAPTLRTQKLQIPHSEGTFWKRGCRCWFFDGTIHTNELSLLLHIRITFLPIALETDGEIHNPISITTAFIIIGPLQLGRVGYGRVGLPFMNLHGLS